MLSATTDPDSIQTAFQLDALLAAARTHAGRLQAIWKTYL